MRPASRPYLVSISLASRSLGQWIVNLPSVWTIFLSSSYKKLFCMVFDSRILFPPRHEFVLRLLSLLSDELSRLPYFLRVALSSEVETQL